MKTKANISLDYEADEILIRLPMSDENLLESHGFMMELTKKPESTAGSSSSQDHSEE